MQIVIKMRRSSLDPYPHSQRDARSPPASLKAVRVEPSEKPVSRPIKFVVRGIPGGPGIAQLAAFALIDRSLFAAFFQPFDDRVFGFMEHRSVLWLCGIDTHGDRKCQWVVTDGAALFVLPVHVRTHTREQLNPETSHHPSPLSATPTPLPVGR